MFPKPILFICLVLLFNISCKKDKDDPKEAVAGTSKVLYVVDGTHFRLNFIDSNSVFKRDQLFSDHFAYEFRKGSGASIGMSIFTLDPTTDSIYSWKIYIDGKLYANAFSEGGAYLTVPYH
jgi:hypothetical protein